VSINVASLSGIVNRPALRFTLVQQESMADGRTMTLYVPCCAAAHSAERLTSELEDGQAIVITSGKLVYRKRDTKLGEQHRMEVLVRTVDQLAASAQQERSNTAEGVDSHQEMPRVLRLRASRAIRSGSPRPRPINKGALRR
jgi:hypothetical protein